MIVFQSPHALTLGNCSRRCSRPPAPGAGYLAHPWAGTSCIHAVVIPSPADAGEMALIPIPSPAGRRGQAVDATRVFVYLEPTELPVASFTKGLLA